MVVEVPRRKSHAELGKGCRVVREVVQFTRSALQRIVVAELNSFTSVDLDLVMVAPIDGAGLCQRLSARFAIRARSEQDDVGKVAARGHRGPH